MAIAQDTTDGSGILPRIERAKARLIGPAPRIAVDYAGAGPAIVFLHGIGGDRSTWAPQMEAFADRYTTVAWDARGYGDSDDYDGPLSFADVADDLARVLDAFAVEKAHLVGLSMGGRICLEFYANHPDRFATLTLAGVHARFGAFSPEAQRDYIEARRKGLIDQGLSPADIAPAAVARLMAPDASDEAKRRAAAGMSRLHVDSYLKTVESTTRFDREHVLADIAVPALVIGGGLDPLTPPDITRGIAEKIPGARYEFMRGIGHLSNLEAPAEFNRLLADFLAPHRDRAGTVKE